MTSPTTEGASTCATCGGHSETGCRCVAPEGLIDFLTTFRAGISAPRPDPAASEAQPGRPWRSPRAAAPSGDASLEDSWPVPVSTVPATPEAEAPPVGDIQQANGAVPYSATPDMEQWSAAPRPAPDPTPNWAPPSTPAAPWPYPSHPTSAGPPGWPGHPAKKWPKWVGIGAGVVGGLILIMVAIPTFLGINSGKHVPPLQTLLSALPASGYTEYNGYPQPNGYLTLAQISEEWGGVRVPKGVQEYAMAWVNHDREDILRVEAIETPTVPDAEALGAGAYQNLVAARGQPFGLPGLSGRAKGVAIPATASRPAEALAVVLRSRLMLLFLAVGRDQPSSEQAMIQQLAQTTASSLPVDSGSIANKPPSWMVSGSVYYRAGEVLGALVLVGLVATVVVVVVRRSRPAYPR